MSLLVVGLSHRTAPVSVLECLTVAGAEQVKLIDELHRSESISEVLDSTFRIFRATLLRCTSTRCSRSATATS